MPELATAGRHRKGQSSVSSRSSRRGALFGGAIAGLALLFTAAHAGAQDQEPQRVPVLTTKFGAGVFEQIVAFERLIEERHPWLRLVAQESPGYVYNLREMSSNPEREKTSVAMSSTGAIWAGATGQEGFFKEKLPTEDLRWLMTRSANCLWFLSTDPDVKSIQDFSGKKIGMGLRSQTHPGLFATLMIEKGAGVDDANLEYLGSADALSALADGHVDAALLGPVIARRPVAAGDPPRARGGWDR
jgi:TRAP-type uncharacterized transport system substrate-binding protein